jgi:hypothetical protein
VTSATKDAVAHALRAFSAIFHRNAWPIRSQRPFAWSMRAICACCSPHRAANRLVQSTFLIGFAMRKVLSIYSEMQFNDMHPARGTRINLRSCRRTNFFSGQGARVASINARFWENYAGESLSDRQRKVVSRLLDGFEGKLTSSKWAKLSRCSQDTASRAINDLVKRNILAKDAAGGRSTSYSLNEPTERTR